VCPKLQPRGSLSPASLRFCLRQGHSVAQPSLELILLPPPEYQVTGTHHHTPAFSPYILSSPRKGSPSAPPTDWPPCLSLTLFQGMSSHFFYVCYFFSRCWAWCVTFNSTICSSDLIQLTQWFGEFILKQPGAFTSINYILIQKSQQRSYHTVWLHHSHTENIRHLNWWKKMHANNPSTHETGTIVRWRPAWATYQVQGHPGLHIESLFQKANINTPELLWVLCSVLKVVGCS
jgi:hypothetical protein